jgi:energy-coupling factor transporter ATP-binding protein EcfA2
VGNAELVQVLNTVEDLKEDLLDQEVVTNIAMLLGEHGEEVTLISVVHDNVDAILLLDKAVHVDDGGVVAGVPVKLNLALLEATLPLVDAMTTELLDSALDRWVVAVVDGREDNTVGTVADYRKEVDEAIVDSAWAVG